MTRVRSESRQRSDSHRKSWQAKASIRGKLQLRTHVRTVVLPHVNEWKRVPKVARGVVAERGRWDGRRCEEEGNGSSREERERERGGGRTHEWKQRGESEKEGDASVGRTGGACEWEKERKGKKRETTTRSTWALYRT